MRTIAKTAIPLLFAAALIGCCNSNVETEYNIEKLGKMPDIEEGFGKGVSACYAAIGNDTIYVAGGCNFPEVPAAEGGSKRYYKGIFKAAGNSPLKWEKAGELPEPSAYGVSLQCGDKWIIAGGMNSEGALNNVYSIDLTDLTIETLPHLPMYIDNAAGATSGNRIYITGGNADGIPSASTLMLDLDNLDAGWKFLPAMPSAPRVQPVCAATDKALYVWGGFAPAGIEEGPAVFVNGVKYEFASGKWSLLGKTEADGEVITLSGGIATATGCNSIVVAGGVNKDIFLDAISGTYNLVPQEEYMYKPAYWYKFNNRLMLFDTESEKWSIIATDSCYARAGAQMAIGHGEIYLIGGELKPGIRTPDIYRITLPK